MLYFKVRLVPQASIFAMGGGLLVFGFAVLVPFYEWFSVSVFTQFSYGFSVSKVTAVCGTGVKSYVDFLFATLFSIGFSVSFLR